MKQGKCVLCSQGAESRIHIRTQSGSVPFSYLKCQECGLVFLSPRPDEREILQFYSKEYYGKGGQKFRSWLEIPRLFFAWNRMRRTKKFFSRAGRALDIGCGQGTFLQLLKREGWECYGTEITEESASRASRAGISVSAGEIQENQFPPQSFDLITFWQVLEHLPEPRRSLNRLRRLLKKGGIIAISTPNIESLQAQVAAGQWFHLDPPRHFYLFSPQTLEKLMESLGFHLLKVYHFCLEQNPYGWLQSLLNLLGLPEDNLYSFLKNTPDRRKKGFPLLQRSKMLLYALGLLPHCLLLSLTMGLVQRGGTFEAYFMKED